MGDGSDRSEPLDPEVIWESPGLLDYTDVLVHDVLDEGTVHGAVLHGYLEIVAHKVSDIDPSGASVDVLDLKVLEVHLLPEVLRAVNGHQLRGHSPLVLGPCEADAVPGHAHAAGHEPDHAVGLPVPGGNGSYRIIAVVLLSGGTGDLPDYEILW